MEQIEQLMSALENDGNVDECIGIVAKNFPEYIENDVLLQFQENQLLIPILLSPDIVYPEPDKTCDFFIKILDKSPETAKYYIELIPLDKLSSETCQKLAEKFANLGLEFASRRFQQIKNLYLKLEEIKTEISASEDHCSNTSEQLRHSAELLDKMTGLLRNTTQALTDTTEQLHSTQEELAKYKK